MWVGEQNWTTPCGPTPFSHKLPGQIRPFCVVSPRIALVVWIEWSTISILFNTLYSLIGSSLLTSIVFRTGHVGRYTVVLVWCTRGELILVLDVVRSVVLYFQSQLTTVEISDLDWVFRWERCLQTIELKLTKLGSMGPCCTQTGLSDRGWIIFSRGLGGSRDWITFSRGSRDSLPICLIIELMDIVYVWLPRCW